METEHSGAISHSIGVPDREYDLSVRNCALAHAVTAAKDKGQMTEGILNRAKEFEKYLRGEK